MLGVFFFFFKQKTAYEMRISDWSSDVCSSDLRERAHRTGSAWLAQPCPGADSQSASRVDTDDGGYLRPVLRTHQSGRGPAWCGGPYLCVAGSVCISDAAG